MKRNDCVKAFNRTAAVVVLAVAMMLSPVSGAIAAPSLAPLGSSVWVASISGFSGPVCVGNSYMLTVQWFLNPANSDILAPLSGPKVISVSAKRGSFDRETEKPGTISGMTRFVYTPQKEGEEQVTVKIFNDDLNVDASDSAQFEVKKCSYRYELYAELYDDVVSEDTAIGLMLTYRSKGLLEAPDPNQPLNLESRNQTIRFLMTATYFVAPDCSLVTYTPATGFGFIDAKAEPAADGLGLDLKIGPPQNADWNIDSTIVCDGKPITVNAAFPISSSKDPWIEQKFPFGEGTYPVKIDILEETVKNARGKGHAISYRATLKMEKAAQ